jgi:hypothetical protein
MVFSKTSDLLGRPEAVRTLLHKKRIGRVRNYVVTAWRNLVRHKLHGFINITGLAIGVACAIFILLFLRDELSWDSWIRVWNSPKGQWSVRVPLTRHSVTRPAMAGN